MIRTLILIGSGSCIGGVLRYLLGKTTQQLFNLSFPFGTLFVNLTGCFLIGIIYGLADKQLISSEWRLFLATGLCGGYTTFSAFSYESVGLIREGQYFAVASYIFCSLIIGFLATWAGVALARA